VSDAAKGKKPKIRVIPPKTIVRKIAVGQEFKGRVRRLTDFGAFIDIGVGTDALVHVSEMGQKRVNKPKDVLQVGQEVTAWIKSLDREHNRISLTLLPPGTRTIRDLKVREVVKGKVTRIMDYGIFVDIGIGYEGMVHVKEMAHGYVKHPRDMVSEGDEIEAEVLKVNQRRGQIDLSMRAVAPEPEPEPAPESEARADYEMGDDDFEDNEPAPTALELAFMKAKAGKQRPKRRRKKQWFEEDEDLDEIISRTLTLTGDA
jgi:4-hydroxy-3-methylbut-2-enyl diphosphate reductase